MVLQMTICNAKWERVDRLIKDPDVSIWDLAKWHRGWQLREIPPILTEEGLTHDADIMSSCFCSRFFDIIHNVGSPPTLISSRNLPTWPLSPIREEEIRDALRSTSPSSTLGPLGIGYLLVRWVFEACPGVFISIFNHALSLGKHLWGKALMVIISKPGKSDYTVAKAYHPISLIECCGKLLEKVIAAWLSWEVDHASLIGDQQFGSHHHYSAPDATLCLAYKAKETIHHRWIGAILLFDISRFFDHLDLDLTAATLMDLGVNPSMTHWMHSFMSDCMAQLSFNDFTSSPFNPMTGTPQGSPLSPILSAITTLPLLRESLEFTDADLTLYVDDGCIFASRPTFLAAAAKVTHTFKLILDLLTCMGLGVNIDKTEMMFFSPPCPFSHHRAHPKMVTISCRDGKTLTIKPSKSLQYLRVFFTLKLDRCLHVTTMANCTHSTVKALGILSSSVQGIYLLSWPKVSSTDSIGGTK
jgi:Reverse transcriptase (RNA-dependent DNA polymerase)